MAETLRSLAQKYGITVDRAKRILEVNNILVLSEDAAIVGIDRLKRYEKAFSRAGYAPKPDPYDDKKRKEQEELERKRREQEELERKRREREELERKRREREEFERKRREREEFERKRREQEERDKGKKRWEPKTGEKPGFKDEREIKKNREEQERKHLSRDYVIFTYMALRKPSTERVLKLIIELKATRKTKTKLVVCEETLNHVMKAAETDVALRELSRNLQLIRQYNMLITLKGRISEENHSISNFIRGLRFSDSILVVGINRGLSRFIEFRNKTNENNDDYVKIYERDVKTIGGYLVAPGGQGVAFKDSENKPKAPLSDSPLKLSSIPKAGERAYYKKDGAMVSFFLGDRFGHGAEANVYKVNDAFPHKMCAKIFNEDSNSALKIKKIEIMCSKYEFLKKIDTPIMERIGWPEKLVYNANGEPVGYLMSLFEGTTEFKAFAYDTFGKIIPGGGKKHQVTMALSLAELVDFMHHNNVVLCDINKGNILFDKNQTAYLVDLDSAQIADENYTYISNAVVPDFLSPEHIRATNFDYNRKKADDIWILQMLLFSILTPMGYTYETTEDVVDDKEAVEKGYYPYQYGDRGAEEGIKNGPWHKVVSHFPLFLKEAFWQSFNGKGKYFHEKYRRDSGFWLNAMVRYQDCLPKMIENDPESGKFIPNTYKKNAGNTGSVGFTGGNLEDLLKMCNDLQHKDGKISWSAISKK